MHLLTSVLFYYLLHQGVGMHTHFTAVFLNWIFQFPLIWALVAENPLLSLEEHMIGKVPRKGTFMHVVVGVQYLLSPNFSHSCRWRHRQKRQREAKSTFQLTLKCAKTTCKNDDSLDSISPDMFPGKGHQRS